jgi:hypothetical protein
MLTTVDEFCQFLRKLIDIHHTCFPKNLNYDIIIPVEYLVTIPDFSTLCGTFSKRIDEWWAERISLINYIIFFNIEADRSLRISITHNTIEPIVTWTFDDFNSLIVNFVIAHHAVVGDKMIVKIPRTGIQNISSIYDIIIQALPAISATVEVAINRDYIIVRT